VDAVLADFRTAPITEAEKALFAFLRKVNRNSSEITGADVAAARRAGWSAEAIYDAINVCGLFNFYNRWIDATGVHEMSAEAHRLSGKRLAQRGYVVAAGAGRGVR
jgi:alkylhydroperoxidase family enzyme